MKIRPIVKHLVLIGGGHSHLAVLRRIGMHSVPGLAVTLITREVVTYSGSLPAHLVGLYSSDLMHIDLRPLAQFAGARLVQSEVTKVNLEDRSIELNHRPDIPFDCLSLNIGSRPDGALIMGASDHALAVKPIDRFLTVGIHQATGSPLEQQAGTIDWLSLAAGRPASSWLSLRKLRLISVRRKANKRPDDCKYI